MSAAGMSAATQENVTHAYRRNEYEAQDDALSKGTYVSRWQRNVTRIGLCKNWEYWVFFEDGSEGLIMPLFTSMLSQLRNDYNVGTFSLPCLMEGHSFVCGDSEVATTLRGVASCETEARHELTNVSNDLHCLPILILIAVCLLSQL